MEMAQYILSLLKTNLTIVFSWGFHRPTTIENGLKFMVKGFKFEGCVSVVYDEGMDLFNITLTNRSYSETIEGVYADSLVEVIDFHVERTSNYKSDVEQWLRDSFTSCKK